MGNLFHQTQGAETESPMLAKTAAIDGFFEKVSSANLSDAQRRYPELLKVGAAPGVGTRPSPSLSKRKTTDTTGPSPTQSSLSGGAA